MTAFQTILEPTSARCPAPLPWPQVHKCEFTLNIGLFFDGTDNNKSFFTDEGTNTNIARIWNAYRENPEQGYFRYYVSGVGTPFTELGKTKAEAGGGPAGVGGEARIVYGLLQIVNSVHRFVNDQKLRFEIPQLAALCSETHVPPAHGENTQPPSAEQKILDQLGISQGLVSANDRSFLGFVTEGERRKFFRSLDADLRQQVASKLPRISGIHIDVFGFSRGAAQARVFVNWLHDLLLIGGQLFGAPAYVRMLGLFDTVASVGVTDPLGGYGHGAWASAENLRIHKEVRNCVHYVALHELRHNFPLDGVAQAGQMPANCQELYSPGAHSDVGGGYAPGEQGKGVRRERDIKYYEPIYKTLRDDGLKLSNLPLNQMLAAAKKACEGHPYTPWIDLESPEGDKAELRQRFGLTQLPKVTQAVTAYFENCGVAKELNATEALRQHGLQYLAWRYRINERGHFETLESVERAQELRDSGLEYYREGQRIFSRQMRLLSTRAPAWDWNLTGDRDVRQAMHKEAPEIFAKMKAVRLGSGVGPFFDTWVHDSYAGFIEKFRKDMPSWARWTGTLTHGVAEAQGYVRWRGLYEGSDERLNAQLPPTDQQRRLA